MQMLKRLIVSIAKSWFYVVVLFVVALILASLAVLPGCMSARLPRPEDAGVFSGVIPTTSGLRATPASTVQKMSIALTWISGVFVLLGVAGLWFLPNKWTAGKIIIAAVGGIICAQLLYWLSQNLALAAILCGVALAVSAALYLFAHRRSIEAIVGKVLDGDGKICEDKA
jgi:hypothetical protein